MHSERPDTRWDRVFCIGAVAAAVGAMGWLVWRIQTQPDQRHPAEFIGIALLLGLCGYFAWLIYALQTVRYTLDGDRLLLQQAWSRAEIRIGPGTHLYRWRQRWSWDGGAQRDLSVEALGLFPPFWLFRESEMWVLHAGGQALVFHPSPQLLAAIKALQREERVG